MKVDCWVTIKQLRSLFTGRPRLVFALVGVLMLGALIGAASARPARAATAQTYVVQVGAGGDANTALLQFAPGSLKVHRGDTVTWLINGFHNVHVGATKPADLIIAPEVNGKPLPQANPQIFFPSGPKSGSTYQGGEAGSGVPLPMPGAPPPSPAFSLVIDMKPGTSIAYLCDIHPGMAGSLTIVDDSETIPSPAEVAVQAAVEFGASNGAVVEAVDKVEAESAKLMPSSGGKATVQMGYDVGRAAILQFFPNTTVIKAGESVTWKFGESAIEPHTVSMPPQRGGEIVPIPQEGKPPILAAGPALAPMSQSGATIKTGDKFSSGLLAPVPGQLPTFTLTFADAGVYPYVCNVHRGMTGVVVVLAK
jgi:plastocyanin